MTYHQSCYEFGQAHGRFMKATESGSVIQFVMGCAQLFKASFMFGWSPRNNIHFWKEVWVRGYVETIEFSMNGVVDGMIQAANSDEVLESQKGE